MRPSGGDSLYAEPRRAFRKRKVSRSTSLARKLQVVGVGTEWFCRKGSDSVSSPVTTTGAPMLTAMKSCISQIYPAAAAAEPRTDERITRKDFEERVQ